MTNKSTTLLALLLCPLLLITGCDRSDDEIVDVDDTEEFEEDDGLDQLSAQQRAAYEMAMAELASALGDDADEAQLLFIQARDWPDSSLGCPQAGTEYLQVVTPGYTMRIAGKGRSYTVNTGGDEVVVCNQPGASVISRPKADLHATQVASVRERAIEDLAGELGVDPSLIQASQLIPGTWTDASLGCPEPGVEYDKQPVSGYRLFLTYQDRAFSYNTDGEKVIACPPISQD